MFAVVSLDLYRHISVDAVLQAKKQEILHLDINLHDSIYIIILVMQLYVFNVQYFFCKYFLFLG